MEGLRLILCVREAHAIGTYDKEYLNATFYRLNGWPVSDPLACPIYVRLVCVFGSCINAFRKYRLTERQQQQCAHPDLSRRASDSNNKTSAC